MSRVVTEGMLAGRTRYGEVSFSLLFVWRVLSYFIHLVLLRFLVSSFSTMFNFVL